MVVFHQISRLSTKLDWLKEEWKSLMKAHSVISCGQIPKKLRHGLCHQEVLVGCSDQRLLQNSTISMTLNWLQEHINLLWTVSNIGSKIKLLLQFGQHPTIAIDAEMLHLSLILTKNLKDLSTFSTLLLRAQELSHTEMLSLISSEQLSTILRIGEIQVNNFLTFAILQIFSILK